MIRALIGKMVYWDEVTEFWKSTVKDCWQRIAEPSKNPTYRPQYVFDTSMYEIRLMLTCYSRGDSITELSQHFTGLLAAWELSNKLALEVKTQLNPGEGWDHRHFGAARLSRDPRAHNDPRAWDFSLSNLNHYNWCFWLIGLALALEIPDDQWSRLLALIDGAGEDILLDRVIASRTPDRKIGSTLLHPKPYARLLAAIDAAPDQQASLLRQFVEHWYAELLRKGAEELWWYTFGDPIKNPLEKGSYFGRWCIEAVAAVKAFGLDDSLCLGHEHYPGDLLRPNGPSTHKKPETARQAPSQNFLFKLFKGKL